MDNKTKKSEGGAPVCVACLENVVDFYDINDGERRIVEKLLLCAPFLDFDDFDHPVVCSECYISLLYCYMFIRQCLFKQDKIHEYRVNYCPKDKEMKVMNIYNETTFLNEKASLKADIQAEFCKKQQREDDIIELIESGDELEAEEIVEEVHQGNHLSSPLEMPGNSSKVSPVSRKLCSKPSPASTPSTSYQLQDNSPDRRQMVHPKRKIFKSTSKKSENSPNKSDRLSDESPKIVGDGIPAITPASHGQKIPNTSIIIKAKSSEEEKPFKCGTCGLDFKQIKNLRQHITENHRLTRNNIQNLG